MPRRDLIVLVQPPPPKVRVEIACDDLDECLSVAASEMRNPYNGPGTKIAVRRGRRLLARWQVERSGARLVPLRPNGRPNENMERLMRSARNAYVYEGMSRSEVTRYLMDKYGASEDDAFLAAAAGKVLADSEKRDYETNPKLPAVVKSVLSALDDFSLSAPEGGYGGVWRFDVGKHEHDVQDVVDALRADGWKIVVDSAKRFPKKTRMVNMRRGAKGSPETQVNDGMRSGGKTITPVRVIVDTKP